MTAQTSGLVVHINGWPGTGKLTIAEFVETQATADLLRDIGVDYAQGFGIARPRRFDARSGLSADQTLRVVA